MSGSNKTHSTEAPSEEIFSWANRHLGNLMKNLIVSQRTWTSKPHRRRLALLPGWWRYLRLCQPVGYISMDDIYSLSRFIFGPLSLFFHLEIYNHTVFSADKNYGTSISKLRMYLDNVWVGNIWDSWSPLPEELDDNGRPTFPGTTINLFFLNFAPDITFALHHFPIKQLWYSAERRFVILSNVFV